MNLTKKQKILQEKKKRWEQIEKKKLMLTFTPRMQTILPKCEWDKVEIKNDLKILEDGGSLLIQGPVGSGKTLYAIKLMYEAKKQEYLQFNTFSNSKTYTFISILDLLDAIKEGITQNKVKEILKKYQEKDFLIIDDFAIERMTEWNYAILYMLINYRYEYKKTTIFTTNLNTKEIIEKLQDHRIISRINEMCTIKKLNFKDKRI